MQVAGGEDETDTRRGRRAMQRREREREGARVESEGRKTTTTAPVRIPLFDAWQDKFT